MATVSETQRQKPVPAKSLRSASVGRRFAGRSLNSEQRLVVEIATRFIEAMIEHGVDPDDLLDVTTPLGALLTQLDHWLEDGPRRGQPPKEDALWRQIEQRQAPGVSLRKISRELRKTSDDPEVFYKTLRAIDYRRRKRQSAS